ncbi:serine protease HTRA2, mitochondrial isoform X2 [Periplaneta americana]|uniref:serine protease HTRA2, mitochondrial isoform X2 n=1 Tax=Periplaneta americana TaxID=6978 RepID=UPI0037E8732F
MFCRMAGKKLTNLLQLSKRLYLSDEIFKLQLYCMGSLNDLRRTYGERDYTHFNANKAPHGRINCHYKKLLISAVIGFGVGLGSWFYRENLCLLPTIEAAKLSDPKGGGDDGSKTEASLRQKYNFIADVVEKVVPSTVCIELKDTKRIDIFTGELPTTTNGSGFIVREDGLILTNAHVVLGRSSSKIQVKLHDGSTYTGVIEDVDRRSDLATIRIQCHNLPVLKLGSSRDLRTGEFVVAIGSPLTLSNSVTAGVISSASRQSGELGLSGRFMDYIQTDASITFGNSGGPLVNLDGEAIGINAMKVTTGISFAIPIDYAKEFLRKAELGKGSGRVRRRYMGITMLTLTPLLIRELQERHQQIPESVKHGVLVWKVVIDSPAHIGGLKPGDIVTHINGVPVHGAGDIYTALEKGGPLKMIVIRGNVQLEIQVIPEDG